mmetsp:Transcript_28248/g.83218  ORF Transcript_28248/g.83218 Transcript_28248/m.83218 type:complete len:206 (-) Transcript_28248:49-666(-)
MERRTSGRLDEEVADDLRELEREEDMEVEREEDVNEDIDADDAAPSDMVEDMCINCLALCTLESSWGEPTMTSSSSRLSDSSARSLYLLRISSASCASASAAAAAASFSSSWHCLRSLSSSSSSCLCRFMMASQMACWSCTRSSYSGEASASSLEQLWVESSNPHRLDPAMALPLAMEALSTLLISREGGEGSDDALPRYSSAAK